jgi:hypothetical protein
MAKPSGDHIALGGFVFPRSGAHMFDTSELDQRETCSDRRTVGRTKIIKGALLFFSDKTGVQACTVRDVTNLGAGMRVQGLKMVPLDFALSFDNFRTVRMCRLIWRQSDFLGVAFES